MGELCQNFWLTVREILKAKCMYLFVHAHACAYFGVANPG